MFQNLTERLQDTFRRLRGRGKLTEADVKEAMREVRLALLEADVNFKVVRSFIKRVGERAVGQEVLRSVTPAQQVIKIVHDEMTELMGGGQSRLATAGTPPTVILLVGLQGAGKTTTAAKLSRYLEKQGRRPMMVAADVHRPAAVDQLRQLGETLEVPVYGPDDGGHGADAVAVAGAGVKHARRRGHDVVIVDTAGRLQLDEVLMDELIKIKGEVGPDEVLLVVDAMTGQEAVAVAERFHEAVDITGVVLTKMDGDTRGGAALSVRAVTGRPIKLVGVGEKHDALEAFHPERMASRILGMGDVLTLVERAQAQIDEEKSRELEERLMQDRFDLNDFLEQLRQVRRMGPLDQVLGMLPGMGNMKQLKNVQVDEGQLVKVEAIIQSMTPGERENPSILNASRRRRVARGSGTTVQDVNRVVKNFNQTRQMVRQLTGMGAPGGRRKGRGRRRRPTMGGFRF